MHAAPRSEHSACEAGSLVGIMQRSVCGRAVHPGFSLARCSNLHSCLHQMEQLRFANSGVHTSVWVSWYCHQYKPLRAFCSTAFFPSFYSPAWNMLVSTFWSSQLARVERCWWQCSGPDFTASSWSRRMSSLDDAFDLRFACHVYFLCIQHRYAVRSGCAWLYAGVPI